MPTPYPTTANPEEEELAPESSEPLLEAAREPTRCDSRRLLPCPELIGAYYLG